jgi:hypothetical protein
MSRQQSIVFIREADVASAELQYSWIPTGQRHDIKLAPGQTLGTETDTNKTPDEIYQIQVYHLYDGNSEAIKETEFFSFPSGLPYSAPVSYAVVEVSQKRRIAVFTAHFTDGASFSEFRPLRPMGPGS